MGMDGDVTQRTGWRVAQQDGATAATGKCLAACIQTFRLPQRHNADEGVILRGEFIHGGLKEMEAARVKPNSCPLLLHQVGQAADLLRSRTESANAGIE